MRAIQPILLAPWLQPCYAHHRFVATYLSTLLRAMAVISGIYSKRAYSSKLQHRLLVKAQPSGSQTFMSRGPLLCLTSEYLIYPWRSGYAVSRHSYLAKAFARGPSEPLRGPSEPLRGPQGDPGPHLRNPVPATTVTAELFKLFAAVV